MPPTPVPRARRLPAFAVIPALLAVALAAACALALAAQSVRFARANETFAARSRAKSAALAGTLIALANLQTYAGTDDCATAKFFSEDDDAPEAGWTGAWHGERVRKEFPDSAAALVSNRGIFAGTRHCRMRDAARAGSETEVPWETLGEGARFAFFVRDESLRASVAKRERDAHLERFKDDVSALQRLRQQISRKTELGHFFEDEDFDSAAMREKIACAPDERIFLAPLLENLPKNLRESAFDALALEARGVPADWTRRQLKIDLSDEANFEKLPEFFPPEALKNLDRARDALSAGTPVAVKPPAPAGTLGWFSHPFPLVAELKLHLGFFNPRSDGQHRTRFHVTARFWNPSAAPLLAHGDGRLGLFDAENLPAILISNENTGGEILFSPTDFPVGRFGLVRQTPSDRTCNAYCRIFDASPQSFGENGASAGLHGGEVYLARFPDPVGQPGGLARNTGGNTWKYQKDPAKIAKPPSGAKADRWFHPAHVIRVETLPALLPANFLIRGDAGTLPQQTDPRDYSEPVFVFKNVPLPAASLEMSGEDYNRQLAGDYEISQASLVWKIRLRAEDSEAMRALFETVEPRLGVFDFSVPAVRRAFEVSTLAGAAARAEAEIGGAAETAAGNPSPLRDRFPNEHAAQTEDAFACIRIFDTPGVPALSVGAMRHFSFEAFPPAASFGAETNAANALFDRAYFSDAENNPHCAAAGEAHLISGAFNFNSENADAWTSVLAHDVPAWRRFSLAPDKKSSAAAQGKNLKNAFFAHPHSAHAARPVPPHEAFSDAELAELPSVERERALLAQNFRAVEKSALKNFAESLVRRLRERRKSGGAPFRSLGEFADSGVVKNALGESGLNRIAGTEIPAWYPAAISQSAILESFSPAAAPRGDTFAIFCRAEIFDPLTGKILGAACAEMRAQRMPEFFDASQPAGTPADEQNALNRVFGRRFKITAFRWLPHDEL